MGGSDQKLRTSDSSRTPATSIEGLLKETPTLDMDLMQFLVVAGFTYKWAPLYRDENRELLAQVVARYCARRDQLPQGIKRLETDSVTRLRNSYEQTQDRGRYPLRTIRDFGDQIAKDGGRIRTPNLGEVTVSYFNTALRYYGLGEIDFFVPRRAKAAVERLIPYSRP